MDFSLSSSLVGSAVSNPDKLALDLQFATDKTLTARRGPTPAFTRGSSGTFVGSNGLIQSAGNNVARFDHDPVTLACKGLLIEESRTNNSWYSGAIVGGVGWVFAQVTSIVDGVGPDGNNAYEIAEDVSTNVHGVLSTGGLATGATSIVSGTAYTGSIFLKKVAGSINWVQVTLGAGGFGTAQYANFNLSTGAIGNFAGVTTGTAPRIEAFPNGWYRCSITVTATTTVSTSAAVAVYFVNNTNGTARAPSYTGSTANKVLAAMAQFETGAFPTSYIPTTTASVIRSADVCSISGSDFSGFYNPLEGSLFTNTTFNAPAISTLSQRIWELASANTLNSARAFRVAAGTIGVRSTTAGATDVSFDTAAIPPSQQTRQSLGLIGNNFAFYSNNAQVGIDTLCSMPASLNAFYIGSNSPTAGGGGQLNGTIGSLRYYKKRLSNAKLQAITV